MKHEGFTAREFIAWNRIVRPGSVIGPQQQFLIDWEYKLRTESEALRVSNSIGSALNKASSVYHETPAGMGGFVRSKMRSLKIVS